MFSCIETMTTFHCYQGSLADLVLVFLLSPRSGNQEVVRVVNVVTLITGLAVFMFATKGVEI